MIYPLIAVEKSNAKDVCRCLIWRDGADELISHITATLLK